MYERIIRSIFIFMFFTTTFYVFGEGRVEARHSEKLTFEEQQIAIENSVVNININNNNNIVNNIEIIFMKSMTLYFVIVLIRSKYTNLDC